MVLGKGRGRGEVGEHGLPPAPPSQGPSPDMDITLFALQALLIGRTPCQEGPSLKSSAPLVLSASIELPGVEGRIDHLAVDLKRERLYVAALGNDSVEV